MPHFREFILAQFSLQPRFYERGGNYISKIVTSKKSTKEEIHNGKGGKEIVATVHTAETKPFVLIKLT